MAWHQNLTATSNYSLRFDNNSAESNDTQFFSSAPTSTTITGGNGAGSGGTSGEKYVMYAWKAVSGVSAFGTYDGTGSLQTITTGFAPSFVMIKSIDSTDSWWMFDNARVASGSRNNTAQLRADTSHDEATNSSSTLGVTLKTDNGFTVHSTGGGVNGSGNTYIYMAFA
jgi:hypothetical protein